jgi:hypothetical protein
MTTQTEIANFKQDVQPPLPIKNYKWPMVLAVVVILAIVSTVIVIIPARAEHLDLEGLDKRVLSDLRALEAISARYQYSADLYAANQAADSQRALESISARYQGLADLYAINSPVDSQRALEATSARYHPDHPDMQAANSPVDSQRALEATSARYHPDHP